VEGNGKGVSGGIWWRKMVDALVEAFVEIWRRDLVKAFVEGFGNWCRLWWRDLGTPIRATAGTVFRTRSQILRIS